MFWGVCVWAGNSNFRDQKHVATQRSAPEEGVVRSQPVPTQPGNVPPLPGNGIPERLWGPSRSSWWTRHGWIGTMRLLAPGCGEPFWNLQGAGWPLETSTLSMLFTMGVPSGLASVLCPRYGLAGRCRENCSSNSLPEISWCLRNWFEPRAWPGACVYLPCLSCHSCISAPPRGECRRRRLEVERYTSSLLERC